MPYKHHDPVSEVEMLTEPIGEKAMVMMDYQGHHSICQTLRDIWAMTDNEEVKLKCRLAMAMAKAMQHKLKKYKLMMEKENEH